MYISLYEILSLSMIYISLPSNCAYAYVMILQMMNINDVILLKREWSELQVLDQTFML